MILHHYYRNPFATGVLDIDNQKSYVSLHSKFSVTDVHEALDHNGSTFKPGWRDIFRMNQNELESEIQKVSQDSTLDPRRKAYLIENLMTRYVFFITICELYRNFSKL